MAFIDQMATSSRVMRHSMDSVAGRVEIPLDENISDGQGASLERPPPPVVVKVSHHNIELSWEDALDKVNDLVTKGDSRVRVSVQEEDKYGSWSNVHSGYANMHNIDGLRSSSSYKYRIRFQNNRGFSDWSPAIKVSTVEEPLSAEHLHRAIARKDLTALESVLQTGGEVLVDIPDKYGLSPLMICSQKGYVEFIEVLVNYGADVNFRNESGKSSLMLAAYAGQTNCVKELRHFGASYELPDKGGSMPLHWAMDGGNMELIDWMVEDGASLECIDINGWTPLLRIAAVTGNSEVTRLVLRLGSNVNRRDRDGKTALMIAVVNGHVGMVETLLEMGADITLQNEYGKNAYEMAISMERRRIVLLIDQFMGK